MITQNILRIRRHENIELRRAPDAMRRLRCLALALLMASIAAAAHALPPDPATGLVGQPAAAASPAPASAGQTVSPSAPPGYTIGPGDELSVRFDYMPEFNTVEVVRPDGNIDLPRIGSQRAAGMTVEELAKTLREAYAGTLRRPDLSINIQKGFASQQVFVGGEVVRPGAQPFTPTLTALQAILVAEGVKDSANLDKVEVLRRNGSDPPEHIMVDINDVMDKAGAKAQDVTLKPFDVVIVPRSAVASLNQWIDMYIRRNIPFNTGFSYVINHNFAGN